MYLGKKIIQTIAVSDFLDFMDFSKFLAKSNLNSDLIVAMWMYFLTEIIKVFSLNVWSIYYIILKVYYSSNYILKHINFAMIQVTIIDGRLAHFG